jgi:hypothetical protein
MMQISCADMACCRNKLEKPAGNVQRRFNSSARHSRQQTAQRTAAAAQIAGTREAMGERGRQRLRLGGVDVFDAHRVSRSPRREVLAQHPTQRESERTMGPVVFPNAHPSSFVSGPASVHAVSTSAVSPGAAQRLEGPAETTHGACESAAHTEKVSPIRSRQKERRCKRPKPSFFSIYLRLR